VRSEGADAVVAVACRGLGEVQVRDEEGASELVGQRAVAAWELLDDGIARDQYTLGNVERNAPDR
jgi:hypothetical protein